MQPARLLPAFAFALGLLASPGSLRAESLTPEKPWQFNLSLAPTKGFLSLGRDFGPHYFGAGLQGLVWTAREGLSFRPGLAYAYRFRERHTPYLGLGASAQFEPRDGLWVDPVLVPAVGYSWRWRPVHLHMEAYLGTPLDADIGRDRSLGAGAGVSFPF